MRRNFQQTREYVRSILSERLEKLGPIRTSEAWDICKSDPDLPYSTVTFHFRVIMNKMEEEGKADRICNGQYFIHKNSFCAKTTRL